MSCRHLLLLEHLEISGEIPGERDISCLKKSPRKDSYLIHTGMAKGDALQSTACCRASDGV